MTEEELSDVASLLENYSIEHPFQASGCTVSTFQTLLHGMRPVRPCGPCGSLFYHAFSRCATGTFPHHTTYKYLHLLTGKA